MCYCICSNRPQQVNSFLLAMRAKKSSKRMFTVGYLAVCDASREFNLFNNEVTRLYANPISFYKHESCKFLRPFGIILLS